MSKEWEFAQGATAEADCFDCKLVKLVLTLLNIAYIVVCLDDSLIDELVNSRPKNSFDSFGRWLSDVGDDVGSIEECQVDAGCEIARGDDENVWMLLDLIQLCKNRVDHTNGI